jgi:hypothetical protein
MDRDQDCRLQLARQDQGGRRPRGWHEVMGLVQDDPVWPASPGAQLGKPAQEPLEVGRPVGKLNIQHVDNHIAVRPAQDLQNFRNPRLLPGVAENDRALEFRIVALGIDHAELKAVLRQPL